MRAKRARVWSGRGDERLCSEATTATADAADRRDAAAGDHSGTETETETCTGTGTGTDADADADADLFPNSELKIFPLLLCRP